MLCPISDTISPSLVLPTRDVRAYVTNATNNLVRVGPVNLWINPVVVPYLASSRSPRRVVGAPTAAVGFTRADGFIRLVERGFDGRRPHPLWILPGHPLEPSTR